MTQRRASRADIIPIAIGLAMLAFAGWYGLQAGSLLAGAEMLIAGMFGLGLLHFALSGGGWKVWLAILVLALLGGILLNLYPGPLCSTYEFFRCE